MGNGRRARQNSIAAGEVREFLFCFAFLASTPGLYRKKCKACQDDNHFNFKECIQCGGAPDIQSPGRPTKGGLLPVTAVSELFM